MLSLLLLSAAASADPGLLDELSSQELDTGAPEVSFNLDDPLAVTGGEVVEGDRWDGTAAIVFNGREVGCTGVLVAPTVVLTAGHCAGGITHVYLNVNNYNRDEGEYIAVEEEIAYPRWYNSYDITLLKLAELSTTPPRIIAQDCILDEEYFYNGAEVVVVGWGAFDTYGNEYDARLREGWITIDDTECTSTRQGCVSSISPGGELGAGLEVDGTDSCYGDSGGPLYLPTDRGDFVVGIVSRGYNTVTVPCGEGGIYVRPDAVIDWIESEGGVTLERPDCSPPNSAPVPTAADLVVKKNHSETATIRPNDPDQGQNHSLEVLEDPMHGSVSLDGGLSVTYTPEHGYTGTDNFTIEVWDDAESPLSGTVTVNVTVEGGFCGCASAPRPESAALGFFALLGLIGLRRRR